jgi:hypothetical protein
VSTAFPFSLWCLAIAPRRNVPRHHVAAGDAGHRAKLGCNLLQVPPPSLTRTPPA